LYFFFHNDIFFNYLWIYCRHFRFTSFYWGLFLCSWCWFLLCIFFYRLNLYWRLLFTLIFRITYLFFFRYTLLLNGLSFLLCLYNLFFDNGGRFLSGRRLTFDLNWSFNKRWLFSLFRYRWFWYWFLLFFNLMWGLWQWSHLFRW
jgi:hypothetical protein